MFFLLNLPTTHYVSSERSGFHPRVLDDDMSFSKNYIDALQNAQCPQSMARDVSPFPSLLPVLYPELARRTWPSNANSFSQTARIVDEFTRRQSQSHLKLQIITRSSSSDQHQRMLQLQPIIHRVHHVLFSSAMSC